jgi:hypothetical protein
MRERLVEVVCEERIREIRLAIRFRDPECWMEPLVVHLLGRELPVTLVYHGPIPVRRPEVRGGEYPRRPVSLIVLVRNVQRGALESLLWMTSVQNAHVSKRETYLVQRKIRTMPGWEQRGAVSAKDGRLRNAVPQRLDRVTVDLAQAK